MSSSGVERIRTVPTATVQKEVLQDGHQVTVVTLVNARGIEVRFMTYGGIILSIKAPDRDNIFANVVLCYDELSQYIGDSAYFGALIGRNANRIANGQFSLDGKSYSLTQNDSGNHLHGGNSGFSARDWLLNIFERDDEAGAELTLVSAAGDQGYPGELRTTVRYTLTNADEFIVNFTAHTDAATPVNLTQHSYFNLSGNAAADVLGHELWLRSSRFLPVDETLIPTGELRDVANSPFDFATPHLIGARIDANDEQLRIGDGYDHNFVLEPAKGPGDTPAARLHEPGSGRVLEIFSTEPAIQLFTGNTLGTVSRTRNGPAFPLHAGVALETQHYPDAPNHPQFPSTILRPGSVYSSETSYRFSVAV